MKLTSFVLLAAMAFVPNLKGASLEVGDPAPALKTSLWAKGAPVSEFATGKVYVVEFWATWCGPCKQSIPHLTELAHQFKDKVTFIGVDVMENNSNTVLSFVKSMGDKMDYAVALDTADTHMANAWLKAAGQSGIPVAFVVDGKGKIAWIGHPMDNLDKTLNQVLDGAWDSATMKKRLAAKQQAQALFNEGMKGADEASILERAKKLEVIDQEIGGMFPGRKFDAQEFLGQIRFSSAMDAYQKAVMDSADAALLDKLEAVAKERAPEGFDFAQTSRRIRLGLGANKAQKLFDEYVASVGAQGDKSKAADLGQQLGQLKLLNPAMYHVFARTILTDDKVKERDLALAGQLAKSAVTLSESKTPVFLDTYALALFTAGKIPEAIVAEKQAVETSVNPEEKTQFAATLKKYEAASSSK